MTEGLTAESAVPDTGTPDDRPHAQELVDADLSIRLPRLSARRASGGRDGEHGSDG